MFAGDSSGGFDAGQAGQSLGAIYDKVIAAIGSLRGSRSTREGRELNQIQARILRQMQQDSLLARKQFEFGLAQAYPDSPVYGSEQPVAFYDIPTKLTTKLTNINNKLMTHPDSKKLAKKREHAVARIEKYKRKHPEAATYRLAQRSY